MTKLTHMVVTMTLINSGPNKIEYAFLNKIKYAFLTYKIVIRGKSDSSAFCICYLCCWSGLFTQMNFFNLYI